MDNNLKKRIKAELFQKDKELANFIELQENTEKLDTLLTELKKDKKISMEGIETIKGDKGDQGIQGIQGKTGPQGEQGIRGEKGLDGKDGKKGEQGEQGEPGNNGENGSDGKDGSSDTPEQIVEKINTLEEVIDYKVLKGIPSTDDLVKSLRNKLDISEIKNWNQPAKGRLDQRWHGSGSSSGSGDTLWKRVSNTLLPITTGDNVETTGEMIMGGFIDQVQSTVKSAAISVLQQADKVGTRDQNFTLGYSSDQGFIYSFVSGVGIQKFDVTNLHQGYVDFFPNGNASLGLVVSSSNQIYYVDLYANTVNRVDGSDLAGGILDQGGTGTTPQHIAISPDEAFVYVTTSTDIQKYDATDLAGGVLDSFTGGSPHGVKVSPDGLYIYVINYSSPFHVDKYDSTDLASGPIATGTAGHGSYDLAVTSDGLKLYIVNYISRTLQTFNTASLGSGPTQTISLGVSGNEPTGIVLTPDDAFSYIILLGTRKLVKYDNSNLAGGPDIIGNTDLDPQAVLDLPANQLSPFVATGEGRSIQRFDEVLNQLNNISEWKNGDDTVIDSIDPLGVFHSFGLKTTDSSLNPLFSVSQTGVEVGGGIQFGGYGFPFVDGTTGQVLTTDGLGHVTWGAGSGGGGFWTKNDTTLYPTLGENIGQNVTVAEAMLHQINSNPAVVAPIVNFAAVLELAPQPDDVASGTATQINDVGSATNFILTQNGGGTGFTANNSSYLYRLFSFDGTNWQETNFAQTFANDNNDSNPFAWDLTWTAPPGTTPTSYTVVRQINFGQIKGQIISGALTAFTDDNTLPFTDSPFPQPTIRSYVADGTTRNYETVYIYIDLYANAYYSVNPFAYSMGMDSNDGIYYHVEHTYPAIPAGAFAIEIIGSPDGTSMDSAFFTSDPSPVEEYFDTWNGGPATTPNTTGYLADGINLNIDYVLADFVFTPPNNTFNPTPGTVSTVDPNDSQYYYVHLTWDAPVGLFDGYRLVNTTVNDAISPDVSVVEFFDINDPTNWSDSTDISNTSGYLPFLLEKDSSNTLQAYLDQSGNFFINSYIVDTGNNNAIYPNGRILLDNTNTISVDWNNRALNDPFNVASLDWQSRIGYDEFNQPSIRWNDRQLIGPDGSTVILDWNSPGAFGPGGNQYDIQTNNGSGGFDGTDSLQYIGGYIFNGTGGTTALKGGTNGGTPGATITASYGGGINTGVGGPAVIIAGTGDGGGTGASGFFYGGDNAGGSGGILLNAGTASGDGGNAQINIIGADATNASYFNWYTGYKTIGSQASVITTAATTSADSNILISAGTQFNNGVLMLTAGTAIRATSLFQRYFTTGQQFMNLGTTNGVSGQGVDFSYDFGGSGTARLSSINHGTAYSDFIIEGSSLTFKTGSTVVSDRVIVDSTGSMRVLNLTPNMAVSTNGSNALISTVNPSVVASNDLITQTSAVGSVTTYTVLSTGGTTHTFSVGGYVTVSSISINTITLQATYTDETSTSRTQSFFGQGLTTAAVSTTGAFDFPPLTIRAKAATAINLQTTVVGIGSQTYDVGGYIQQIN